jgi:hypothetical protein
VSLLSTIRRKKFGWASARIFESDKLLNVLAISSQNAWLKLNQIELYALESCLLCRIGATINVSFAQHSFSRDRQ